MAESERGEWKMSSKCNSGKRRSKTLTFLPKNGNKITLIFFLFVCNKRSLVRTRRIISGNCEEFAKEISCDRTTVWNGSGQTRNTRLNGATCENDRISMGCAQQTCARCRHTSVSRRQSHREQRQKKCILTISIHHTLTHASCTNARKSFFCKVFMRIEICNFHGLWVVLHTLLMPSKVYEVSKTRRSSNQLQWLRAIRSTEAKCNLYQRVLLCMYLCAPNMNREPNSKLVAIVAAAAVALLLHFCLFVLLQALNKHSQPKSVQNEWQNS